MFNLGDGQDTISDYEVGTESGKADRIVFGEGIREDDIIITRSGYHMVLEIKGTSDKITVQNQYNNPYYQIENVEFADGTKWTYEDLTKKVHMFIGTDQNNSMGGYDSGANYNVNEEFYGKAGNDAIYGYTGDDLIVGGRGNDNLQGGYGNDTYMFNLGDGQDTISDYEVSTESGKADRIVFGEGISATDLYFKKEGNNLKISVIGTEDSINVSNYFSNDYYKVENYVLNDGSTLAHTQIEQLIQAMASFEATSGIDYVTAVTVNQENISSIMTQMWVK